MKLKCKTNPLSLIHPFVLFLIIMHKNCAISAVNLCNTKLPCYIFKMIYSGC